MFMLNLLFDPTEPNGRFFDSPRPSGPPFPSPLTQSVHWLKLNVQPAQEPDFNTLSTFDPENAQWDDLGPRGTLLLPFNKNPGLICFRVAPIVPGSPSSNPPTPLACRYEA
jgi:hypothetical protein